MSHEPSAATCSCSKLPCNFWSLETVRPHTCSCSQPETGGLIMLLARQWEDVSAPPAHDSVKGFGVSRTVGAALAALWLAILIGGIVARSQLVYADARIVFWFESFWRTGSLIFGGGQVSTCAFRCPEITFLGSWSPAAESSGYVVR